MKFWKFITRSKYPNAFIFLIILRDESEQQYLDVIRQRKSYNKKLKKIALICDIDQSLTSYLSRHSFATNVMLKGIPLQAIISTILGHSKLNTTQI
mgnify:CR=1 FL=1|tara:strand:- start:36870 stop:37157 length:288 start_codon:yes stop_codon:yes gene_type:complete